MLQCWVIFCWHIAKSFLNARCWVIFHCYNAQPFFAATVISHSSCKRSSVIFWCYSTQSFSLLQLDHLGCYSTQSFLVITAWEAAQSFCKMIELHHGCAGSSRVGCRTRGARVGRSVRWLGPGDRSWVHQLRWWIVVLYIYIFITLCDRLINPSSRAKVQPIKHRPTPRVRAPPIKHRLMRDQSYPHTPDTYCYAWAVGSRRAGDVAAPMT
jgi:hypothetical protein